MIELPKKNGTPYTIGAEQIAALQRDYPRIDVDLELRKARNWLEANPRNRKMDVHRFVINWLNRARPQGAGAVSRETSQHYALATERLRAPAEPVQYAPPGVARAHVDSLRRLLGMRRTA